MAGDGIRMERKGELREAMRSVVMEGYRALMRERREERK